MKSADTRMTPLNGCKMNVTDGNKRLSERLLVLKQKTRHLKMPVSFVSSKCEQCRRSSASQWPEATYQGPSFIPCRLSLTDTTGAAVSRINFRLAIKIGSLKRLERSSPRHLKSMNSWVVPKASSVNNWP